MEAGRCEMSFPPKNAGFRREGEMTQDMPPDLVEAIAHARERGAVLVAELFERPEMLSCADIADRMGITQQAVHEAWQAGHLLAVSGNGRGNRFPAWQLDRSGTPLRGLAKVIEVLGNGWSAFRFLAADGIDRPPRHVRLAKGKVGTVLDEAQAAAVGDFV